MNYKNIIIILTFCTILLSGCGKDFEKKEKCVKYLPEIEADMEKSERELPSIDTGYPQFNVSQIFYSPRLDTCLVDINNYYSNWNNERILMDVLTRKTIIRYVNQRDIAEFIEENDVINHEGTLEEYNERVINYK